jgi:autotransporter passenger strand-loop-strand repeat protein
MRHDIDGGGTVSNLTLDSGDVDVVNFGTTVGTTGSAAPPNTYWAVPSATRILAGVESIGAEYSFNTTVFGGAVEVLSGVSGVSSPSDTTVLSGGELIVAGGAIAIDAVVAGTEILQGGEDYNITIESGGLHVVQYRSEFTVLSGGAEEIVSSGGMAISTSVDSGAIEIVSSGGAATDLAISSGGIAVVSSGGSTGATELEGGYELVASGGIVSGATISAGTLEVASGGAMASPSEVAFAGGGTLQLLEDALRLVRRRLRHFGSDRPAGRRLRDRDDQERRADQPELHRGQRRERHAHGHRWRPHRQHPAARPVHG